MTDASVAHDSFIIERRFPVSSARVFRAFSDPARKRSWFVDDKGFDIESHELDFRVEGFERTRFRRPDGIAMTYDGIYLDIQTDARIVYAYSMTMGGAPLSSSLGTIELFAQDHETLLRYTEYVAFLDGRNTCAGRRGGTAEAFEALAAVLGGAS